MIKCGRHENFTKYFQVSGQKKKSGLNERVIVYCTATKTGWEEMNYIHVLYVLFWLFLQRLIVVCRRFGSLYLFHLHTSYPAYEDGTDRVFWNVGIQQSDAGDIPKRIHTRFKTRRKFEIKYRVIEKEGVTLEKSPPPQHVHMTHHRREHRPSVSRSPTCSSRVNDERLRCLN